MLIMGNSLREHLPLWDEYMTKKDRDEIKTYKKTISHIRRGYGKAHIKKHEFLMSLGCVLCQSMIAIAFLEEAIDLVEWKNK